MKMLKFCVALLALGAGPALAADAPKDGKATDYTDFVDPATLPENLRQFLDQKTGDQPVAAEPLPDTVGGAGRKAAVRPPLAVIKAGKITLNGQTRAIEKGEIPGGVAPVPVRLDGAAGPSDRQPTIINGSRRQ